MIKTLSPYYVTIPFVSPLTGVTCSKYTLKIYVWDGLKSAVPSVASYSMTKTNPTSSTGSDKINISRLINDFIDFAPNESNQRWCKTSVTYDTSTIEELQTINLVVRGYGYGMEGQNPDIPVNRILMQGLEFKVNRDGVFNLPIKILEPTSTINAVNETVAIFFQDTIINVLTNDNLGFAPTSIIGITTTMPSSVGTLSIVGSTVKFTKGTAFTTPQTFTYTIQDSATVTLNISVVPALPSAVNETYNLNNADVIDLMVLANDALGVTPTTITAINTTGITTGSIAITGSGSKLTFTPNGVIESGETFTYTITDSASNTSTGTVTLNVTEAVVLIDYYYRGTSLTKAGYVTYRNQFNEISVSENLYLNECRLIQALEIISTYLVIPCE
jgi:hypothetical protein